MAGSVCLWLRHDGAAAHTLVGSGRRLARAEKSHIQGHRAHATLA